MSKEVNNRTVAFEHAWEWFHFHADQRLKVFNFYLIIVGALIAGTLTVLEKERYAASALLCMIWLVTTFLFFKLDQRNR